MIIRHTTGGTFVDAEALYVHLGRRIAIQTIRARCTVTGKDPASGRQLYNLDDAEEALADVKPRNPHQRATRRSES